jgi:hypothetical protein
MSYRIVQARADDRKRILENGDTLLSDKPLILKC